MPATSRPLHGGYPDPQMRDLDGLSTSRLRQMLIATRQVNEEYLATIARLRAHNDAQHRSSETATARYLAVCEENGTLREALEEISMGAGPFSRDPLTFASNTIEAMKGIAVAALDATAPEGEGHA